VYWHTDSLILILRSFIVIVKPIILLLNIHIVDITLPLASLSTSRISLVVAALA